MVLGTLTEWWCKLVGRVLGFMRSRVKFACMMWYYNIDKVRRLLGYKPVVHLPEGVRKACEVSLNLVHM